MTAGAWFMIGVAATVLAFLVVGCLLNRKERKLRYHGGVLLPPERELLRHSDVRPVVPAGMDDVNIPLLEELGMVEETDGGRYAVTPFGKEVGRYVGKKESYHVD